MTSPATISADHHQIFDAFSSTRVLMVVANPSVNPKLGWPLGFWAAELMHPYFEFTEAGFDVTVASPDGGTVEPDALSDPRDPSKWSAGDLISMGFLNTPECIALLQNTPRLADLDWSAYDALVVCGGQSPMFTFRQMRISSAQSVRFTNRTESLPFSAMASRHLSTYSLLTVRIW